MNRPKGAAKSLDNTDRRILEIIKENARASVKEIAAGVGLSSTPVFERIRRMERNGIIRGYTVVTDPEMEGVGFSAFVAVKLDKITRETTGEFRKLVHSHSEITDCYAISGRYDYLLRVRATDMKANRRFIIEVFGESNLVSAIESFFVMNEEKNSPFSAL